MVTRHATRISRRLPLGILLFTASSSAVSLSDFAPSCTGLTPSCQAIYIQPITGCTPSDFSSMSGIGATCSPPCIAGMFLFNNAVFNACAGDPANNQNIIGQFLVGSGVHDLCGNAAISTSTSLNGDGYGTTLVGQATPPPAPYLPPDVSTSANTIPVSSRITPSPAPAFSPGSPFTSSSTGTKSVPSSASTPSTSVPFIPPFGLPSSSAPLSKTSKSASPNPIPFWGPFSVPTQSVTNTYKATSVFTPPPSMPTLSTSINSIATDSTSPPPTTSASNSIPPFDNPPAILTQSSILSMLPPPSVDVTAIQPEAPQPTTCVPNGGGGSTIGDSECPATSVANSSMSAREALSWRWVYTGMAIAMVGAWFTGL